MRDPLAPYIDRFADLADRFHEMVPGVRPQIAQKRQHSLRVLKLARTIMTGLSLDPQTAPAVELAALFHDVGRFPQAARYHTFVDAHSENHAKLSLQTIVRTGVLADVPRRVRKIVLPAVVLHNRPVVPKLKSPDQDRALRILRDADKLDIIESAIQNLFEPETAREQVAPRSLSRDHAVDHRVLERIKQGRLVDKSDIGSLDDYALFLLSWVYDFNFEVSLNLYLEAGHFDRLWSFLPSSPELMDVKDVLSRRLSR
jgi:hypothetical protein